MNITVNNKTPRWPIYVMLVLIGLLAIALYKGCKNVKSNKVTPIAIKERIKKLEEDSAKSAKEINELKSAIQVQEGQLELSDNKLLSLTENLGAANERITALLRKHIPIQPSLDTNVTTVPNQFINECAECFTELENGQKEVIKYKAEKDNQEQIFRSQLATKDKLIKAIEKSNVVLAESYKELLDSTELMQNRLEQRRILYFKMGALAINQPMPNGIGAGFMYQDKRKRIFSIGYYITEYKTVYQAEVAFPLSLRKSKIK